MTFRDFLKLEQGTQPSASGLNAGGRAGQSPVSPEGPVKQMPNLNTPKTNKVPASPFNPSSQFVTAKIPPGPGPVDPLKTVTKTPASNFLPGSKRPQPTISIPNKTN